MSSPGVVGSAAVILTGGRSSRMGGPKEEIILADGRPMISHVIAALAPLDMPIHLSCSPSPGEFLPTLGLSLIKDDQPFEGPLAAIAHALEVTGARRLLVVCCDQPLLSSTVLARLVDEADIGQPSFFRDGAGTRYDPFPGVFPLSALASMRAFLSQRGRSPRQWIADSMCHWVEISGIEAGSLKSLNTAGELRAAGLIT